MLIITNLQLERERERDFKEHKKYILSLHTSDSKFTNDMDFWIFFFYLSFVLCYLDLVLVIKS